LKKNNGFSLIEVLVAFSMVIMLVFTILPIITLIRQEEVILSDRRHISNRLHDELQPILWNADPLNYTYTQSIRSYSVEFIFENEDQYIKGCAYWKNIKDREEKICLYGFKEK